MQNGAGRSGAAWIRDQRDRVERLSEIVTHAPHYRAAMVTCDLVLHRLYFQMNWIEEKS